LGVPGSAIRQELNRLINYDFRRVDGLGLRGEAHTDTIYPCIDIAESETAIEVAAELPGVVNRILSYGYDFCPKLAMAHPAIPFTYRYLSPGRKLPVLG
jgi:hypothetical protein